MELSSSKEKYETGAVIPRWYSSEADSCPGDMDGGSVSENFRFNFCTCDWK